MEFDIKEANTLFEKINKELLPRFRGKIVAIDTDSGNYFVGNSELDAYKEAIKNIRIKNLFLKDLVLILHILLVLYNERIL